ncbi:hypothetical protein FZI94_23320 [Mycobacterium sp. CBMA226]|nr:hypothetical protein [Mycolicibacterium sp. CBMA 226]
MGHALNAENLPGHNRADSSAARCPPFAIRTLPLRLEPVAGESVESWMEALGSRSGVTWGEVLTAVGLHDECNRVRVPHFTVSPTTGQLAAISYATGVRVEAIASMTSSSLFGTAPAESVTAGTLTLPRSRFCPICLAESGGRWQLWWKLRWAFACPKHRCLLVDICPSCCGDQRRRPLPGSLVPQPGRCTCRAPTSWGRSLQRCGTELSTAPTVDLTEHHPALAAQKHILAVMAAGFASFGIYAQSLASALQFITDITVLGQQIMRYACVDDVAERVPADLWMIHERNVIEGKQTDQMAASLWLAHDVSATMAVAACAAMPVLQASDPTAGGQRLRWLIGSMRAKGAWAPATAIVWDRQVSAPLKDVQLSCVRIVLGPTDQLRHRVWSQHPRRPDRDRSIHRSVPASLWPGLAFRVNAPGVGMARVRMALSVALFVVGSRIGIPLACARLGSVTTAREVGRVLGVLSSQDDWATTASMLTNLAECLGKDVCPIDYQRRRELVARDLLTDQGWRRVCRDAQMPLDDPVRARLCDWWLRERLTGSPQRRSTATAEGTGMWQRFIELPATLSPEEVKALDRYGRTFLDAHGMASEPLRWHPPLDALGIPLDIESPWFGVDAERLHGLIRVNKLSMGMAACALNVSIDVVRETLNDYPAPRQPRAVRGALLEIARAELPRDRLIDLYCRQGQSLWAIALLVGVSPRVVGRLAREYGIPLRPPLS